MNLNIVNFYDFFFDIFVKQKTKKKKKKELICVVCRDEVSLVESYKNEMCFWVSIKFNKNCDATV